MTTQYFIGPVDVSAWIDADDAAKPTSDLRIDPAAYERALVARWPDVGIVPKAMSHCLLYWDLPESAETAGIWGQLFNDCQLVSFVTGPARGFLDFIFWHRATIPDEYPLYLFQASTWETLPLTAQTTEADILAFTGITP
jgi:hypothetical protein